MDDILFDVLFIIGSFVCGVAIGYVIGIREKDEKDKEDKSCINMVNR